MRVQAPSVPQVISHSAPAVINSVTNNSTTPLTNQFIAPPPPPARQRSVAPKVKRGSPIVPTADPLSNVNELNKERSNVDFSSIHALSYHFSDWVLVRW